jgi:hypothetical protein
MIGPTPIPLRGLVSFGLGPFAGGVDLADVDLIPTREKNPEIWSFRGPAAALVSSRVGAVLLPGRDPLPAVAALQPQSNPFRVVAALLALDVRPVVADVLRSGRDPVLGVDARPGVSGTLLSGRDPGVGVLAREESSEPVVAQTDSSEPVVGRKAPSEVVGKRAGPELVGKTEKR